MAYPIYALRRIGYETYIDDGGRMDSPRDVARTYDTFAQAEAAAAAYNDADPDEPIVEIVIY